MHTDEARAKLIAWMELENMTGDNLAEAMDVDPGYISMIRLGKRPVTPSFRWKFGERFGFDLALKLFGKREAGGHAVHSR